MLRHSPCVAFIMPTLRLIGLTNIMSIPLVFKFGAEKGRVLLLVSFLIPAGICFGIYQLLTMLGVALTDQIVFILLCCSPLLALAWCYVMYQISYRIFVKQEL